MKKYHNKQRLTAINHRKNLSSTSPYAQLLASLSPKKKISRDQNKIIMTQLKVNKNQQISNVEDNYLKSNRGSVKNTYIQYKKFRINQVIKERKDNKIIPNSEISQVCDQNIKLVSQQKEKIIKNQSKSVQKTKQRYPKTETIDNTTESNGSLVQNKRSIRDVKSRLKLNNSSLLNKNRVQNVDIKSLTYYVEDVKQSMKIFNKDPQYIDSYLSHFMDAASTFQTHSYTYFLPPPPKQIIQLPLNSQKNTLIFDLDQTLIHTELVDWQTQQDGVGKIVTIFTDLGKYKVRLFIRPHARQVLQRLKDHYQIGLFTASQQAYAKIILKQFDPSDSLFSFKLFRQHCFQMNTSIIYVKDLRVLGGRDLNKVVLIDNSPQTYVFQKSNGVPMVAYYDSCQDEQFLKLQHFFMELVKVKDLRSIIKAYFKTDEYHKFNNISRLLRQLYY